MHPCHRTEPLGLYKCKCVCVFRDYEAFPTPKRRQVNGKCHSLVIPSFYAYSSEVKALAKASAVDGGEREREE